LIMTSFLNRYVRYFQFITGIILLITGVLIFNGSIQSLGFQLNSILPSLEMLLI
jgi:ATP/ADP translocase